MLSVNINPTVNIDQRVSIWPFCDIYWVWFNTVRCDICFFVCLQIFSFCE